MKDPLWMPQGSVRGLIALGTLSVTIAMLLLQLPIPDAWWAWIGSIGTFYFVTKTQTPPVV